MSAQLSGGEQLALPGLAAPRARTVSETGQPLAAHLPIARVCVDVTPAHLDRLFDYTVPRSEERRVGKECPV